jgi:hypothetical protein
MDREKVTVVARCTRFEPTTTTALAANPVSPVVLQGFMEMLASQGQKVDTLARRVEALATRPRKEVMVAPALPAANPAPKVKSPADTTASAKTRAPRIKRSRLLNIFD